MQIPFFSFFGKKEKPEYFLALLLRDEKVSAVIFEQISGQIRVINKHNEYFEKTIEETPLNDILDILDKTISTTEAALPKEIETQKTVFGLKENWVEESKIKKNYLTLLKKISEALGLVPIGFLVIHEAIAHLLQQEEGAPVSAILVEVEGKSLAISILRAGRIIDTKRTNIENSAAQTVDKTLHFFEDCEVLPSRIILFNSKNHEKLQQEFISYSWSKNLPFLHMPQITVLSPNFDAKSVLAGAAAQMGLTIKNEELALSKEKTLKSEEKLEIMVAKNDENTLEIENKNNKQDESFNESFGFIKDGDVAEISSSQKNVLKKDKQSETEIISDFKINGDNFDLENGNTEEELNFSDIRKNEIIDEEKIHKTEPSLIERSSFSKKITDIVSALSLKLLNPIKPLFLIKNKKLILIPVFIIIAFSVISLFYFLGLRSEISITVEPKIIQNKQDIIFSTNKNSDFSKNILTTETVSITENGSMSTETTGKKEIGEKAKGTVIIYSRFTEEKTLPAGTTLTSSNNLLFTLDNAVKLASASADASSTPVTVKTPITAKNIGKESNLPSGTKFSIGSEQSTTIIAKNETAFAGGSKKETTVVAKADLDKLLTELPKSLEEKARKNLLQKISSNKDLLPSFSKISFTDKEFAQKLGQEAKTVSLKGDVTFEGLVYDKTQLDELSKEYIQNDAQKTVISKKGVEYDIKNIKIKSEKEIVATINIKANVLPKIEVSNLKQELTGKSFEQAKEKITEFPQISDVEISLWPNLPFLPNKLPFKTENITISVLENE